MRKLFIFLFIVTLPIVLVTGQNLPKKIIILISEQNIDSPQRAWWASEIDLSMTETVIAKRLIDEGFVVLGPEKVSNKIKQKPAFRIVQLSEESSLELADAVEADYVLLGKAIVSAGSKVLNSNMRSCFANITAKLLRTKDKQIVGYFEADAVSAHLDAITGGKEALTKAAEILSQKILDVLKKEGGKQE
ncbi:MAG: hypothetical protein NC918_05225 [Candidatus Omnitrophica bacterium]|nr:hypothetical protein [Candidatus Omnitrophota bacterium]